VARSPESYKPPALVDEAIKKYDEAKKHHDVFVRAYERRERSYRGVLQSSADASRWNHKLHPPLAFSLIETMVASTIEEGLKFSARPSPHVNSSMEEAMELAAQAEGVEALLRHEHRVDDFDAKQRPLFLSAAIGGTGVMKSHWNLQEGSVKRQGVEEVEVHGANGEVLGTVPTIVEIEEHGILRDHSTTEIIDPRDFIIHESAQTLQPFERGGAQHCFHRAWYSMEQLKLMEAAGFIKNVDYLTESRAFDGEYADRETEVYNVDRTKDLVEVLEYWCFKNGQVHRSMIGNRRVLIQDESASPFWHGGYPFELASSMPGLVTPRGTSDVELVEQLQEMLWELMNQRLDNVELINNAIMLIRSDVDDPDAFEHYPGARWEVDDVAQVAPLMPPYQLIGATHETEALIRGDIQNVTGASPFASGTESAAMDQKTATGVSIVQNAAQQRLQSKKYQAQQGLRREANMRLKNCQQFIDDTRLVHTIGEDGAVSFREIGVLAIQGEFLVELEPMSESLMRQEKRAEAIQLAQVLASMAPLAAAAGQPINVHEVVTWMLKKWDIVDYERFFSKTPQPAVMGGPGQPGGGAPPPGETGPNMGITAETAVDASKPSATGGMSLSPEMFSQRAAAMAGGPMGGAPNA
jgi:hypothetical protein